MKKIALISSFCNDSEKIEILNKNIDLIKSYGIDVLVISPFSLPDFLMKKCDYFFVTKDNPVLDWPEKATYFWTKFFLKNKQYYLTATEPDYGFAGLNQVKQISQIALNLDYDQFYHMIYDLEINENVISGFESDKTFSIYPSKRGDTIWAVGLHYMIFNRENLQKFISYIDRDNYVKSETPDAFVWLHKLHPILNYQIEPIPVEDKIFYYGEKNFFNHSPIKGFRFFIVKDLHHFSNYKIFFYEDYEFEDVKLFIETIPELIQVNSGDILDLGFNPKDSQSVGIYFNSIFFDLTQIINKTTFTTLDIL